MKDFALTALIILCGFVGAAILASAFVAFVVASILLVPAFLALPLWFFWTVMGAGQTYFPMLPEVWQSIPFLHFVGFTFLVTLLIRLWGGVWLGPQLKLARRFTEASKRINTSIQSKL